jgi:phosphocarrier protein
MKQFTYRIEDPNGMHARPAGALATYAKQFVSDVRVRVKDKDKEADGKRLLALMSLGAVSGSDLIFSISGADEDRAAPAIEEFCRAQLGGK